jgi:hypothetical protein
MSFGLTNAPATFQFLMSSIFELHICKFVIMFLDNIYILICSCIWAKHVEHLQLVMQIVPANQLFAKKAKCSFAQSNIHYLWHMISSEGVATDTEKTDAMLKWRQPTNVTELRGFPGLTSYSHKFVNNYGMLAKPLTSLLTKKGFLWTPQATNAFETLTHAMSKTPILGMPDFISLSQWKLTPAIQALEMCFHNTIIL